jgi:hypothetical protein
LLKGFTNSKVKLKTAKLPLLNLPSVSQWQRRVVDAIRKIKPKRSNRCAKSKTQTGIDPKLFKEGRGGKGVFAFTRPDVASIKKDDNARRIAKCSEK